MTRARLLISIAAAAALALPGPASAQRRPRPPENCGPFACAPRPIPPKLPSEEALALGRRIVRAVDGPAVARRNLQLVALAQAREAPRAPAPPDGRIRAVPPVDLANYPQWGTVLQERVIDHAALYYAETYALTELQTMAVFFETPVGRKLVEERQPRSAALEERLASRQLEDDLWNVACGVPVPQEVEDAPHHEFKRLHPPFDFPLPPRPAWCAGLQVGE